MNTSDNKHMKLTSEQEQVLLDYIETLGIAESHARPVYTFQAVIKALDLLGENPNIAAKMSSQLKWAEAADRVAGLKFYKRTSERLQS